MVKPYVAFMAKMIKNPDLIAKGLGSILPDRELARNMARFGAEW